VTAPHSAALCEWRAQVAAAAARLDLDHRPEFLDLDDCRRLREILDAEPDPIPSSLRPGGGNLPTVDAALAVLSRLALAEIARAGMGSPASIAASGAMAAIYTYAAEHEHCPKGSPQ